MTHCLLDTFPVELIHHLLDYFHAHEIFYTFTSVSPYIDSILLAYSCYRVNFKSVTRQEFNFACQRIIPNRVISLTLCDGENTSGQVEVFLSRFQINQFTNLRSLTLIEVGPDYWEPIVTKLTDLKKLESFFYISWSRGNSWISKIATNDVTQLDQRLFDSYGSILPQLNRLRLSHGNFLKSVQFPSLYHLIIERCAINIIQQICHSAPQLKSLTTKFNYNRLNRELIFPFGQLNRLDLMIEGENLIYFINRDINACFSTFRFGCLDGKHGTTINKSS